MKLAEMLDVIRSEADIQGNLEYQNLLVGIINQELQRYTGKGKFRELLKEFNFTFVANEQHSLDFPVDFQLFEAILYTKTGDTCGQIMGKGTSYSFTCSCGGWPRFYSRFGNTLKIYPYSNTLIGDSLTLLYYYRPELLLDTDDFPVPSLETAVIQASMSRILRMKDTERARMAKQESMQAFFDSRAESTGS